MGTVYFQKVEMRFMMFFTILALVIGAIQAQEGTEQLNELMNIHPDIDLNKELLLGAAGQFFDLENAGTTKLGRLLAWKGDLLQPVILVGMGIFTIYTGLRIILVILSGILDIKANFFVSIISFFQQILASLMDQILMVKNPIIEKINAFVSPEDDDKTPAKARRMRAIDEVADIVSAALNKYD